MKHTLRNAWRPASALVLPVLVLAWGSIAAASPEPASASSAQSPAYAALMHGRVEEATTLLRQAVAANASDGGAHLLLCRAAFAQDQAETAVEECERAAAATPSDADAQMWLGRALGMRAEHVNPMSAFGLAKRVHAAFEKAHELAPRDAIAASDLGQFYINAPGIVGGGADKARALAASMMPWAPARAHRLLGLVAQKNKDLGKAEVEFKAAIDAGKTPEAYTDLALFYQQTNRPDDTLAAVKQAIAADRTHGPSTMDDASILIDADRDPALAEATLRSYLRSDAQTDSAPVFKAHLLLGNLLAKRGEKAAAHAEYAAAVALAPHFEPARKALKTS